MRLFQSIIVGYFILMFGCTSSKRAVNSPFCTSVLDSIERMWKYDSLTEYYSANYKWLVELNNRGNETTTCFIGRDTTIVGSVFGHNYVINKNSYYTLNHKIYLAPIVLSFPLSKPCRGHGKDYHCSFLKFYCDNNGFVLQVCYEEFGVGEAN